MAPFVFSIPIYFSELWQILSIYCQTKENSPLLMKSFWFKYIIFFNWFCNYYLISQAMWRYCSFDDMHCVLTIPKRLDNKCFLQVLIGWRKGMVDKWKRFASEMGRYWMEFIPIQLALCHQVCPTEWIDTIFNRNNSVTISVVSTKWSYRMILTARTRKRQKENKAKQDLFLLDMLVWRSTWCLGWKVRKLTNL